MFVMFVYKIPKLNGIRNLYFVIYVQMLKAVIANYIIVAVLGVYLAIRVFSKKTPELLVGIIHGALGLLGLGMLVFYISFRESSEPIYAFLALLMTFFFGAGMLATTMSRKKYPKVIAVVHILFALTGLFLLLGLIFRF